MNKGWRRLALLTTLLLAAAACGSDEPTTSIGPPGGSEESFDGAWVLTAAMSDGTPLALLDDYRVTMTIEGASIGGRAACNSYGGSVSIDDGAFSIAEISQTEMGCEQAVMEIESKFLRGLMQVTRAERSADTAFLTGEGVEYTFELLPPIPTADLIGVTWVLESIIQGDTATSTATGADPSTLRLDPDGTFRGSTGCRGIAGEYVVTGDIVQFTSFGADGECPAELQWQDNKVVTVLGDRFTAAVDGNRLTVTASGGAAISYRVEP